MVHMRSTPLAGATAGETGDNGVLGPSGMYHTPVVLLKRNKSGYQPNLYIESVVGLVQLVRGWLLIILETLVLLTLTHI